MKRIIPVCFFNSNAEVIFLHSISAGHREKWTNVGDDALFLCSFLLQPLHHAPDSQVPITLKALSFDGLGCRHNSIARCPHLSD